MSKHNDPFLIIGPSGQDEESAPWKGESRGEGNILGEFYRLFVVKKGRCPRCKKKTRQGKDGRYYCKGPEGCGAIYSHEKELVAPED